MLNFRIAQTFTNEKRMIALQEKKTVKFTSVHPENIITGMFEGFSLNFLGRLIAPPVKNPDIIAKGIVEIGLNYMNFCKKLLNA
jgi:hypothetical protein